MKLLLATLVLCGFLSVICFAAENPLEAAKQSLDSGDFAGAKEQALAANEASPSTEAFFILGKAEFGLGEFDRSIDAYSEAIALDPEHAESYAQRGMARTNKGMGMNMFAAGPVYMKALDDYKKAIEVDPDNLTGQIGLTRYYSNAPAIGGGSMKKAKEHAAEVARVNPYLGHIETGLIAQKENRLADAQTGLGRGADDESIRCVAELRAGQAVSAVRRVAEGESRVRSDAQVRPEPRRREGGAGGFLAVFPSERKKLERFAQRFTFFAAGRLRILGTTLFLG